MLFRQEKKRKGKLSPLFQLDSLLSNDSTKPKGLICSTCTRKNREWFIISRTNEERELKVCLSNRSHQFDRCCQDGEDKWTTTIRWEELSTGCWRKNLPEVINHREVTMKERTERARWSTADGLCISYRGRQWVKKSNIRRGEDVCVGFCARRDWHIPFLRLHRRLTKAKSILWFTRFYQDCNRIRCLRWRRTSSSVEVAISRKKWPLPDHDQSSSITFHHPKSISQRAMSCYIHLNMTLDYPSRSIGKFYRETTRGEKESSWNAATRSKEREEGENRE